MYLCNMLVHGKKILIVCVLVLLAYSHRAVAQVSQLFYEDPRIDSAEVKELYLEVRAHSFFKNNEFLGEKVKGYTLLGFRMMPQFSLALSKRVRMEVGVNLLRFWGGEFYPCYSYLGISQWESEQYQKGVHILPVMRAQFSPMDRLHIVFGTLYNLNNHWLSYPIFNNELNYTSDPENGVQVLYENKYYTSDVWLNWQSFIFENENQQEMFVFGYSSRTKLPTLFGRLDFSVPLFFLAQHRGGEINSSESKGVKTASNYGTGLIANVDVEKPWLNSVSLGMHYFGFLQNVGSLYPFSNGWAVYPELTLSALDFKLHLAYWVSEDFITLLGSPHFGNMSAKKDDLVFDKMDMFVARVEYCYLKSRYFSFGVDGSYIRYFPYTGTFTDNTPLERGVSNSFSFGLYLNINPKVRVCNLSSRID